MRKAKELSALVVSRLKAEGRYSVGGVDGLCLRISGNSRAWTLRVMVGGRRRDIGLGGFPDVSLSEARETAREMRKQIRAGIDPVEQRKAAKLLSAARTTTFDECAKKYIDSHKAGWKNDKHAEQWRNTLATYVGPVFGLLPVAQVDTALVMLCLESIWTVKPETASRLRGRIESVLDWATVHGYREGENPARWRGHLDKLLPKPTRVAKVRHHPALSYNEIADFMAILSGQEGFAARALELTILTALRTEEILGALWCEFDFEQKIWIIPAERMKAKKEHRVPLSAPALAILRAMQKVCSNDYVFPGSRDGKPLSNMAMLSVLKRMGRTDITVHGFRSTFRDWAAETTSHPREVIEHALAHQLKDKAEAAYQRGDLLVRRAALMDDWARFATERSVAALQLVRLVS